MSEFKRFLKVWDKEKVFDLIEKSNLSDIEYWLIRYAIVEKRMRENTCMKLSIGKTKYHTLLNEALIKLEMTYKSKP